MPETAPFLGLHAALRHAPSLQVLADLEARSRTSRPAAAEALVVGNPAMPIDPDGDGESRLYSLDARWPLRFRRASFRAPR